MKKLGIIILAVMLVGFTFSGASAATIGLFDWGFNIDGTTYCAFGPCDNDGLDGTGLPAAIDATGFDFTSGLGSVLITLGGVGAHNVDFFVDHKIDELINTFFNETGATSGTPAAGQSWEIDEPGFGVPDPDDPDNNPPIYIGDIFDNLLESTLDEMLFFDGFTGDSLSDIRGGQDPVIDDVSMALGWDFSLAGGETGLVSFILSDSVMPSGFHLAQNDPDSDAPDTIYFSSTIEIIPAGQVPEPATMLLLGTGLVALACFGRKRFNRN